MPRGHLEALARKLRIRTAEFLHEIDELSIVEAVARAPRHAARPSPFRSNLEPLEARRARVLQRRKAGHDGRRHQILEIHPEGRRLDIQTAIERSSLHTTLEAARRFRLEHALVFRE